MTEKSTTLDLNSLVVKHENEIKLHANCISSLETRWGTVNTVDNLLESRISVLEAENAALRFRIEQLEKSLSDIDERIASRIKALMDAPF